MNGLPPRASGPRAWHTAQWLWRYERFSDHAHARHGATYSVDLARLKRAVVTSDLEAVRRLYTLDPLRVAQHNEDIASIIGSDSLLQLDPSEHLARRAILRPSFTGARVRQCTELITSAAHSAVECLGTGEVTSVRPVAQRFTMDVVLETVLGVSDPALRTRISNLLTAVFNTRVVALSMIPRLLDRGSPNPVARRYWSRRDDLDDILLAHIAATRTDPGHGERRDILATMVAARDDAGEGLAAGALRDELFLLFVAGNEATATALAWAAEVLARRPDVVAGLRSGDDRYADAVTKEVLRLHPPSPNGPVRRLLDPFPVGAWTLPVGTPFIVDIHGLHHDPALFPSPAEFRPERFLDGMMDPYAFGPFGGGAHRCIGAYLAMTEIAAFLRELVRYDLVPAAGPARAVRIGPVLAPRGGAKVRAVATTCVNRP